MIEIAALCLAAALFVPVPAVNAAGESGPYAPAPSLGTAPSGKDWYAQIGGAPVTGAIERGAFTGSLSPASSTDAARASVGAGVGVQTSSWWPFGLVALIALVARWRFGHLVASPSNTGEGRST